MPYVQRDKNGVVIAIKRGEYPDKEEFLSPNDAEIINFLHYDSHDQKNMMIASLMESDLSFSRAAEDLINLLIKKNVILFTELPPAIQAKIGNREQLRSKLGKQPYSFLDDSDSI